MSTKRTGMVLVVCAPSGAGKTTLIKRLRKEFPNFGYSISYTTRAPREGEEHGRDYNFVSIKEFKEKRDAHYFAEWAQVHGNYYGSPLQATLDKLEQGQDLIFDVDVQGASQLRLTLPAAVYVFIMPPSIDILRQRLEGRATDSPAQIEQRISNAVCEVQEAHWFDYWVVNDDLEKAYDQFRAVYLASTLSTQHNPFVLNDVFKGGTFINEEN